jgi:hypothetical protein
MLIVSAFMRQFKELQAGASSRCLKHNIDAVLARPDVAIYVTQGGRNLNALRVLECPSVHRASGSEISGAACMRIERRSARRSDSSVAGHTIVGDKGNLPPILLRGIWFAHSDAYCIRGIVFAAGNRLNAGSEGRRAPQHFRFMRSGESS